MRIGFKYEQEYLPNRRCRKVRKCYFREEMDVEIKEVTEENFPIAFKVRNIQSICKEKELLLPSWATTQKHMPENVQSEFVPFTQEIRSFQENLYRKAYRRYGAIIYCNQTKSIKEAAEWISREMEWISGDTPSVASKTSRLLTTDSVLLSNNREERQKKALLHATQFVIFKGEVWETCEEPMYVTMTSGLGRNHGGTALMITASYNPNIASECYFRASDREAAIAYTIETAKNRGDTDSLSEIGKYKMIEVVDPSKVRRLPEKRI